MPATEMAAPYPDVLDRRAVRIRHCAWTLGTLGCDAIVGHREVTAVDDDVPAAVEIDAVGAGCLLVIVRHLEPGVTHLYAVAAVYMQVSKLRIPEGDAVDHDPLRVLDDRQPGAIQTDVRKARWVR